MEIAPEVHVWQVRATESSLVYQVGHDPVGGTAHARELVTDIGERQATEIRMIDTFRPSTQSATLHWDQSEANPSRGGAQVR